MSELDDLQREIEQNNIAKGFRDRVKEPPEQVALFHSECSEALDEVRNGHAPTEIYYTTDKQGFRKPEGYLVELADTIIRILGEFEHYKVSANEVIRLKHEYNKLRPPMHGGKAF